MISLLSVATMLRLSESIGDSIQAATPRGRSHHVAICTGEEMVIRGGWAKVA